MIGKANFDEFYSKNLRFLTDHLRYNSGLREEDAEEVAQSTFLEVWQRIEKGEEVEHQRALLKKVGTWRAVDHMRKKHGSDFERNFVSIDETLVYSNPDADRVEIIFEMEFLKKLIGKLTNENHKRVIELHYFEHKSFREIANELKVSENTIHGHHHQLKRNFKRAFLAAESAQS